MPLLRIEVTQPAKKSIPSFGEREGRRKRA
jgi:hypothetical protein